jgi:hypothetical protein
MGGTMNQQEFSDNSILIMKKLHRWRMAFFGLVILLAGLVIGSTLTFLLMRRVDRPSIPAPEFEAEQVVRRLGRQLNLSNKQMKQLEPILRNHMQKLHDIRMEARPQIMEQLRLMNEEISSVLNEEQKQLWQRHLRRLQAELRQPRRHRAGSESRLPDGQRPRRQGRERFGPPPPAVPNEPPPLELEQF